MSTACRHQHHWSRRSTDDFAGALGMAYTHRPDLAPTQPMLDDYKKRGVSWATYEERFLELMGRRGIENGVPRELLDNAVLLCSEDRPHHCHRRLVAEYLVQRWDSVTIEHLI
ncbi:DUF488 domain-containing protein [Gandjariella thermophila]|nr:DUF488 domain-containing protein [Gandjariella thermophila]